MTSTNQLNDDFTARLPRPLIPRLALSQDEAAEALGIHRDTFERHVLPHVRTAPIGRRRVIAVRELERYLEHKAV